MTDRGDLYSGGQIGQAFAGMPKSTDLSFRGAPYVYFVGGQNSGFRDNIQYFDGTTTSGGSSDGGDISVGLSQGGATAGYQYGFICGGYTASSGVNGINIIHRIDTNTTNSGFAATDTGDMTYPGRAYCSSMGGFADSEIANIAGGYNGSAYQHTIQYLDLSSSTGNMADKGDLTDIKAWNTLCSGDENFIMMCGNDSSVSVAASEYWDISTGAVNATARGNANAAAHGPGGGAGYSGLS
jgi:hypothetical protein